MAELQHNKHSKNKTKQYKFFKKLANSDDFVYDLDVLIFIAVYEEIDDL